MRHTISVTVENRAGVLSRVVGLFSGRGFNIDSLSVGETIDPEISRVTIVTNGDDRIIEQVTKQLRKLIDVGRVIRGAACCEHQGNEIECFLHWVIRESPARRAPTILFLVRRVHRAPVAASLNRDRVGQ